MLRNETLIKRRISDYLIAGIIVSVSTRLANIVDIILVGNILGSDAMASVQLLAPVITCIQIVGNMIGAGGSIVIGKLLGERKVQSANGVFTATLLFCAFTSLVTIIALVAAANPLVYALAGSTNLAGMALKYYWWLIPSVPLFQIGFPLCQYINVDGFPSLTSKFLVVSNAVNLVFDYILLKYTSLGVGGASLSTFIGYTAGLMVLLKYAFSKNRTLRMRFDNNTLKGAWPAIRDACKYGRTAMFTYGLIALKNLAMNYFVVTYCDRGDLVTYTICANVVLLAALLAGGAKRLIPSIVSILNGEKDYYGIRYLLRRALTYASAAPVVLAAAILIFPSAFSYMYGLRDASQIAHTNAVLRIFALALPFRTLNETMQTYYQTIMKTALADMISFLQNAVLLIPICYVMAVCWRFNGIIWGTVTAEVLTALAILAAWKLKFSQYDSIALIPNSREEISADFSIGNKIEEASALSKEICDFARKEGIPNAKGSLIGFAAEEIAVNTITFNRQRKLSVAMDINLTITPDEMLLRIRDDGNPFNPLEYLPEEENKFSTDGIVLVKKIATSLSYVRALNFNNTTVAISRFS